MRTHAPPTLAPSLAALGATLALAVGACAGGRRPAAAAPEPAADDSTPLVAELLEPDRAGHSRVSLSRPAYVALFEIVPGRGVTLLHPQRSARAWLPAGLSYVRTDRVPRNTFESHAPPEGTRVRAPREARGAPTLPRRPAGTVELLVASTTPLDLSRFRSGDATRRHLGPVLYASRNPRAVVDSIASTVRPPAGQERTRALSVYEPGVMWEPLTYDPPRGH